MIDSHTEPGAPAAGYYPDTPDDDPIMGLKLGAALAFAARGWPVFPVHTFVEGRCTCGRVDPKSGVPCTSGKHPATPNGFKDATTDPDVIRSLKNWHAHNVGIRTGDPIEGGGFLAVIDVDTKHGAKLDRVEGGWLLSDGDGNDVAVLPPSYVVRTGNGGAHWYGVASGPIKGGNRKLGKGIDVKAAEGGYVVAPPSRNAGGIYAVVEDDELAEWPADLVELLRRKPPVTRQSEPATTTTARHTPGRTAYGEAALNAEVDRVRNAPEGERNETLNKAAFNLGQLAAGGELEEGAARAELAAAAADAGLSAGEIALTTGSGIRAGRLNPRSATTRDRRGAVDPNALWGDRQPLPPLAVAEAITPDLLPEVLRAYVCDEAERLNVALEMVAVPLLVSLGAVIGRKVSIAPKRLDPWVEHPTLWGMTVGRASSKKTAAFDAGIDFVKKIEARIRAEHEKGEIERKANLKVIDDELKKGKLDAKKTEALMVERLKYDVKARRLTVSDSTVEKVQDILAVNQNGLLLRRDELAGWMAGLERKGREGERQFYLESWSGKGDFACDRIMRGTTYIPHCCMSVIGTTQPSRLKRLFGDCTDDGGDGLLARFGLFVWPENREPAIVDRRPDREARSKVMALFESVDCFDPVDVGAEPSAYEGSPPVLRFSEEDGALDLSLTWQATNAREAHAEKHPGLESHRGKMSKTFAALAGIFHIADVLTRETTPGAITVRAAGLAAEWCDLLLSHARKLYAGADPDRVAMVALAERIEKGDVTDGLALRDVYRPGWVGLRGEAETRAAAEILARLGWLRLEALPAGPEGGRPSMVIRLHPDLRGKR